MHGKIFCVGVNKTGTTTMKRCFEALGIEAIASPKTYSKNDRKLLRQYYSDNCTDHLISIAHNYTAFEDRPWNLPNNYSILAEKFPDAKFILTERSKERWWDSVSHWIASNPRKTDAYLRHFGEQSFSKQKFIEKYLEYNRHVKEYFLGNDRLLVLRFEDGDGWPELCDFLKLPVPKQRFPHANRQKYYIPSGELSSIIGRQNCKHCGEPIKNTGSNNKIAVASRSIVGSAGKSMFQQMKAVSDSVPALFLFDKYHRIKRSIKIFRKRSNSVVGIRPEQIQYDRDKLAVVSCFFNATNSDDRTKNFRVFIEGIKKSGVRLLVVEVAYPGQDFCFGEDVETIQLRAQDVMWQKERLLNIGISKLIKDGVPYIAWLDGDIRFQNEDWPNKVIDALESNKICQVFSRVGVDAANGIRKWGKSSIKHWKDTGAHYRQSPLTMRSLIDGCLLGGQSGFGWAARASVLSQVKLYENAIVGGADKLMLHACLETDFNKPSFQNATAAKTKCPHCNARAQSINFTANYHEWASEWAHVVGGAVGYADNIIEDMFHGQRQNRQYSSRHNIIYRNKFDPDVHLVKQEGEPLRFAGCTKKIRQDVEAYFYSRRDT